MNVPLGTKAVDGPSEENIPVWLTDENTSSDENSISDDGSRVGTGVSTVVAKGEENSEVTDWLGTITVTMVSSDCVEYIELGEI